MMIWRFVLRLLCLCYIQHGVSFSQSLQPPRAHYTKVSSLNAAANNDTPVDEEGLDNNVLPNVPVLPSFRDEESTKQRFIPPIFTNTTKDEANFIKSTLMTNFMFQSLPDKTLDKLVLAFEKVEYTKGSVVIQQGDPITDTDYFYLIQKGECTVTVDMQILPSPYGTLSAGSQFGVASLLYNVPRKATVSAKSDTITLFRIDRKTFRYFLDRQQPQEIDDVKQELKVIDSAIDKVRI